MIAPMRRSDRALDEAQCNDILSAGEYGVLSLVAAPGRLAEKALPYGVPVSYALLDGSIVFHCAPEGLKVSLMRAEEWASFCVVGRTRVIPGKFTTLWESVLVQGPVRELHGEEKIAALRRLAVKYLNHDAAKTDAYIEKTGLKVAVYAIGMEHVTGKGRLS